MSFDKLLLSKGYTVHGIVLKEFAAFLSGCTLVVIALLVSVASGRLNVRSILGLLSALFMLCALDYLLFQCTGNLINGTLYCFFATLALCFAGGCLYPTYFFPSKVQKVLSWLPHCLAKERMAGCLTGSMDASIDFVMIVYGFLFLSVAFMIRNYRIKVGER